MRKRSVLRFHTLENRLCPIRKKNEKTVHGFHYRYKININIKLTKKGMQQPRSTEKTSVTAQQDAGGFYLSSFPLCQFFNLVFHLTHF